MNGLLLIAGALSSVALMWAVLLTLQTLEHKRFVRTSLSRPPAKWNAPPGVLICVPCKGLELGLAENLRCVLRQNYPKYRVRFIVEAVDDPACAVIEQLMSDASVGCELLVAGTCTDSGQKVHNLCYATAELPDDVELLVFFDSDARPAPDAVARFVDCCCRGGLQVATGYRWFVLRRLSWANLTLASINAAVSSLMKHHGYNFIWGGSWAITRELFERTGVRDAWRGTLSDDLVATRVLRLAGVRIVFEPACMAASPIDVSWREAARFLRRQFLIGRCYAPVCWWATVPLMLLQPLILFGGIPLAATLAHRGYAYWPLPLLVSGSLYGLAVLRGRWRQAVWSCREQGKAEFTRVAARFDHWAAPLSCLFAVGTMFMAAVGRSIVWRGIYYHIGAAGRITVLARVPDDRQRRKMLTANARRRDSEKAARRAAAAIGGNRSSAMRICLWDTRKRFVSKDFAGGFGVGMFPGGKNLRQRLVRWGYRRDRRPVALNFAYLAAILRKLGHRVEYCVDRLAANADVYIFNPALQTIDLEQAAIQQALAQSPRPRVLVLGAVAHALPEKFTTLGATVARGEPEQLLWKLDEVLSAADSIVDIGTVRNLDDLPWPDWSLFESRRFAVRYDFTRFPTGLIQQSRGCTFTCNYCPYIMVENKTRFRDPEHVAAEMRHGMRQYGFQSFKFRDPLFGLDRQRALRLAELIGNLPRKIQFSVESRIDLLRPETLRALKEVGLTSVTVGIETPHEETLRQYKRVPIRDDKQREFIEHCRQMGIRTVAGFMIGFPDDTETSIERVLGYARRLNPTYANFNIVTPYPGTPFFAAMKHEIAEFDFTKYDVYQAVLKYQHLTPRRVMELHGRCFERFYFRMRYLRANAHLIWPWLPRLAASRAVQR